MDVFPTVMKLVGGKLPNVTMDGVDMAPILFNNQKVLKLSLTCLATMCVNCFRFAEQQRFLYPLSYKSKQDSWCLCCQVAAVQGTLLLSRVSSNTQLYIHCAYCMCNRPIAVNEIIIVLSIHLLYRGLCPDFYPDTVCRGNYSLHSYDPPLLYNLHNDPSEIYALDVKEYTDVIKEIEMVSACAWYNYGSLTVCIL